MTNSLYFSAEEVGEILGISTGHAYKLVKRLNKELEEMGYIVFAGRVPKKFLKEKCYGISEAV